MTIDKRMVDEIVKTSDSPATARERLARHRDDVDRGTGKRGRWRARREVTFMPGALLLPCPFCGWVSDGMCREELWRHLTRVHEAAACVAVAEQGIEALAQLPGLHVLPPWRGGDASSATDVGETTEARPDPTPDDTLAHPDVPVADHVERPPCTDPTLCDYRNINPDPLAGWGCEVNHRLDAA